MNIDAKILTHVSPGKTCMLATNTDAQRPYAATPYDISHFVHGNRHSSMFTFSERGGLMRAAILGTSSPSQVQHHRCITTTMIHGPGCLKQSKCSCCIPHHPNDQKSSSLTLGSPRFINISSQGFDETSRLSMVS